MTRLAHLVSAAVLIFAGIVHDVHATAEERIDLKLLYAGHPGSAREKDFVDFLKGRFAGVDTTDLAKFRGRNTEDYDVMILDYDGDGFEAPRPKLPPRYDRATVTVGVIGAFIGGNLSLKTGYL